MEGNGVLESSSILSMAVKGIGDTSVRAKKVDGAIGRYLLKGKGFLVGTS